MKDRIILLEEVPCWFELSWQEEKPSLLLKIHSLLIPTLIFHPQVIESYQNEFSFQSFAQLASGTTFGFDNAFQQCGNENGFLILKADLPRIRVEGTKKCLMCAGAGKDKYLPEQICLACRGDGKEPKFSWERAYALSATLSVLLAQLKYPHYELDTPVSFPQLLTVSTVTKAGMQGGSLYGTYSKALCEWFRMLNPHGGIPEMNQAMRRAYSHLLRKQPHLDREFQTDLANGNGWLNVRCPGNACSLSPYMSSDVESGRGYEFSSNNVDGPAQQLTLLAGLAALHDKARRELNSAS